MICIYEHFMIIAMCQYLLALIKIIVVVAVSYEIRLIN